MAAKPICDMLLAEVTMKAVKSPPKLIRRLSEPLRPHDEPDRKARMLYTGLLLAGLVIAYIILF